MRHCNRRKKAQGVTSETDSFTGKLEGQSYNYSSAMTSELIFLNICISNFRYLTVAATPSQAWQVDKGLQDLTVFRETAGGKAETP